MKMVLIPLLILGGCGEVQKAPVTVAAAPVAAPAPTLPRYQMIAEDSTVYVLDTQTGVLAHCYTTLNGDQTWCSKSAKVDEGSGSPYGPVRAPPSLTN